MNDTLGGRIRSARRIKKMTQEALADSIGAARPSISYWETGRVKPDSESISKLAAVLEVPIAYLLGETEITSQPSTPAPDENRSKTQIMFDELMMKMAAANPDLIIHFRDLQNNINNLTPGDIQALADAYAHITSQANEEIEKRLKKTSRHGDI